MRRAIVGFLITCLAGVGSGHAVTAQDSAGIAFESTDDPAVFKVVDRVGDSRSRRDTFWAPVWQIAVGPDGTVWALDGAAVWQVGSAESHALPIDPITLGGEPVPAQPFDLAVTPDGLLWVAAVRPTATATADPEGHAIRWDDPILWSFDGEMWMEHWTDPAPQVPADRPGLSLGGRIGLIDLHVAADGTLHGLRYPDGSQDPMTILSVDEKGLTTRSVQVGPDGRHPLALVTTPDGQVWIGGGSAGAGDPTDPDHGFLLRIDGEGAEEMRPLGEGTDPYVPSLAVGPDGSLWALLEDESESSLTRFDGHDWTVYSEEDGVPSLRFRLGGLRWDTDRLVVGLDGRVWVSALDERPPMGGVASFDGSTWSRYLEDAGINDIAVAPDGSLWATDSEGIYVIHPEAATFRGIPVEAGGTFQPAGSLAKGRNTHTATLLPDGRVLVIGGGGKKARSSAEFWDPVSASFGPAGSLAKGRKSHTATLLPDGRVLVVGGGRAIVDAELWDPASADFGPAGSLAKGRKSHTATLLPDGRVLIVGGWNNPDWLATAEVWDPETASFEPAGALAEARVSHTATLLDDGRVLVVGGHGANVPAPTGGVGGYPDEPRASAEVWDPTTKVFSPASMLAEVRSGHTATLLPDGRALIVGGSGPDGEIALAEVWDPATAAFEPAGSLIEARFQHTATLLLDGRVLVVGGTDSGSTEVWDPVSASFSLAGSRARERRLHTATGLPDGRVLVVGGLPRDASSSAEVWEAGGE